MEKERVFCYVDGYNIYRSVREFVFSLGNKHHIWCDLFKLAESFIDKDTQQIERLYYCSSPYAKGKSNLQVAGGRYGSGADLNSIGNQRPIKITDGHQYKIRKTRLAQANYCRYHRRTYGSQKFKIIFGYFAKHKREKGGNGPVFEEKQTDVNIALLALDNAHYDLYDHAFILSGDGDFAPVAKYIKKLHKRISFILPPSYSSQQLTNSKDIDAVLQINGGHLSAANFEPPRGTPDPDEIF